MDQHSKYIKSYFKRCENAKKELETEMKRPNVSAAEVEILKQHHRFLLEEEDGDESWEQRVAKNYYNQLIKTYALVKFGQTSALALRWRSLAEVISGKGQFVCGSVSCSETVQLTSWEVLFGYMEKDSDGNNVKKKTFVKVRLCGDCSQELMNRKPSSQSALDGKTGTERNKPEGTNQGETFSDLLK
jgi:protein FRA10AC1